MSKLIKLSDSHYIVVDKSEIKEGDFVYHPEVSQEYTIVNTLKEGNEKYSKGQHIAKGVYKHKPTTNEFYKKERKITHSTQPLEGENTNWEFGWDKIKPLNISEVEEVINGYSLKKISTGMFFDKGFNAHKELTKDKMFTLEDMQKVIRLARVQSYGGFNNSIESIIQSLLPKTEWDIEFDEQGKIKLL